MNPENACFWMKRVVHPHGHEEEIAESCLNITLASMLACVQTIYATTGLVR